MIPKKEEYMRGYSDGFKDGLAQRMQPPAGGTIRTTQDGGMEDAPVTAQSAVGASSPATHPAPAKGVSEATEVKRGNFIAVTTDEPQINNWHTAIYEDDYKGLLIAMCNQNGRYPWQVNAILAGLNGKREAADTLTATLSGTGKAVEAAPVFEPGTVRVCPVRDATCPHGLNCPYSEGWGCKPEGLRSPSHHTGGAE